MPQRNRYLHLCHALSALLLVVSVVDARSANNPFASTTAAFGFPRTRSINRDDVNNNISSSSTKVRTNNAIARSAENELQTSITAAAVASLAVFSIQFATLPATALAADDATVPDIVRGETLFTENCASYHAGGMNYVKEKKTLKEDDLAKFIRPDFDQPTVQKWVQNSGQHNRIVFFKAPGGKLSNKDWADVTSFVVDQALNDKW